MDFRRLTDEAHRNAVDKGFYGDVRAVETGHFTDPHDADAVMLRLKLARLALIGTEVSEAVEALRKGASTGEVGDELADIVIRTMDLAGFLGVDLESAIEEKMERNRQRPRMHGKLA